MPRQLDKLGRRAEQSVVWVQDRFGDTRKAVLHTLDDGRRYLEDRFRDTRKAIAPEPEPIALGAAPVLGGLLLVAGAGAAFWWWTQWSRGRAEALAKPGEGGEGPKIDHPELVMAHHQPPPEAPLEVNDPADAGLVEPVPELMMHAPVQEDAPAAAPGSKGKGKQSAASSAAADAPAPKAVKATSAKAKALASAAANAVQAAPATLDDSLAVQGAATPPKATRPRKTGGAPTTSGAAPRGRKGPTVM